MIDKFTVTTTNPHAAEHTRMLCGVLALDVAGDAGLLLYVLDADELVGDGVDDEAGGAVYL